MEGYTTPVTVEEVFRDFEGRREGIIKSLTTDSGEFYQQCDPEKENLCLYGFPSKKWKVMLPAEEVPPELPEPVVGINLARDGMQEKAWLSLVAAHSDAWLISVAFYFGARSEFRQADRQRLFSMINVLPTVLEVVNGASRKQQKAKSPVSNQSSNKSKSNSDCGACGKNSASDGFWILCDICKKWFHGECVEITPDRAAQIEEYKCPKCSSNKRART